MLEDRYKPMLLSFVRLLTSFDKPLLWDGKTAEQITSSTNLDVISFYFTESQQNSWKRLHSSYEVCEEELEVFLKLIGSISSPSSLLIGSFSSPSSLSTNVAVAAMLGFTNKTSKRISSLPLKSVLSDTLDSAVELYIDGELINAIKKSPILKQNDLSIRGEIAVGILNNILTKYPSELKPDTTQSRILMFEIIRSCFNSGDITEQQKKLLHIISVNYKIEGEAFNELLAQAIALAKELKNSINLVLE